jgi:nitrate reductase NapAB chaperone NapD
VLFAIAVNISGVLVVVRASELQPILAKLGQLKGVDVHHIDASSGRIVATIEATTTEAEVEILEQIKRLPAVILAEMVEHHIDVESASDRPETDEHGSGDGR